MMDTAKTLFRKFGATTKKQFILTHFRDLQDELWIKGEQNPDDAR